MLFFRIATTVFLSWVILVGEGVAGDYVYNSRYTTIHYSNQDHFEDFVEGIQPDAFTRTLNQIFLGDDSPSGGDVGPFVDKLFKRVQLILDMPLPRLKVKIRIMSSQSQISRAYRQYGGARRDSPPAFYTKKINTIFVQRDDISVGMLAHEMAHAVIDHYFVIRPPEKVAEMLCQYVDKEISSGSF